MEYADAMESQKTSVLRKLAVWDFDLAAGGHNFFGLLEFDIFHLRTTLRQARREGKDASLYAFFLKAVAHTVDIAVPMVPRGDRAQVAIGTLGTELRAKAEAENPAMLSGFV